MKEKAKIALVLGSGGAKGLAHIGVLKVLEKNNIPINLIVGTSIGAFVGAFYATGMKPSKMEELALKADKKFVAKMLLPSISTSGFLDGEQIKSYLYKHFGDVKIEDLKIPFAAVATDITTGEEFVHTKGSLVEAILTSIAIPGLFKPVKYKQKYLVDGGLVNPLPVSVAKKMDANVIIAVNVIQQPKKIKLKEKNIFKSQLNQIFVNFRERFKILSRFTGKSEPVAQELFFDSYPTIIQTLRQSVSIMENRILNLHLLQNPADVLITPDVKDFDLLAFYKAREIISAGDIAAINKLNEINRLIQKYRR